MRIARYLHKCSDSSLKFRRLVSLRTGINRSVQPVETLWNASGVAHLVNNIKPVAFWTTTSDVRQYLNNEGAHCTLTRHHTSMIEGQKLCATSKIVVVIAEEAHAKFFPWSLRLENYINSLEVVNGCDATCYRVLTDCLSLIDFGLQNWPFLIKTK